MSLPPVVWKGNLVDLSGSDSDGEVGRSGEVIRAIVHHRIVGSVESTIREFTDASASGQSRRVSSQFAIGYVGPTLTIVQFVAIENTAYCNGQTDRDRAACTWQPWIRDGRPSTNRITVSVEHEDNGSAGRYVVVEPILAASIELDRLLLSGNGPAIRAAGIHCSDAAAKQLKAIVPGRDTLIDHKVIAPISKPFCWRAIGDDAGFPQARYLAALKEEPVIAFQFRDDQPEVTLSFPPGGTPAILRLDTGKLERIDPATFGARRARPIVLVEPLPGTGDRRTGYAFNVSKASGFALATDVTVEPIGAADVNAALDYVAGPAQAVLTAALDYVAGPAQAVLTAIQEARR